MKSIFTILIAISGCCVCAVAQVQHPNSKEKLAFEHTESLFGPREIDSLVVKALAENAPDHFNAPELPRFSIIGKDRKYYLGIGGYAKTTLSYDFDDPIANATSFSPNAIPMHPRKGDSGLVQFGAGTSNISFNFVGLPETENSFGVYFNFNFNGPDYGLSLLNAYARYRGFTIGYGLSLFTDAAAGPATIDFAGPNSFTFVSNTVINYEYEWGRHWGTGIGLEMPMADYAEGAETYAVNQRIPDIPLYIQYSWNGRGSWVRLSGILRNMLYRDEVADKNRNSTGWGVKMSGSAVLCKKVTTFYQAVYGEGIANYIQDTNGNNLDMLPSKKLPGQLENVTAWGGYAGLQYNFTSRVFMSATYSFVRTSAGDAMYAAGQYKNGRYIVSNLFWNLAPQVQMGLEYLWGERENSDGLKHYNSRAQTMVQFNF